MTTGIELRDLRKRYEGHGGAGSWAVDGVDMQIGRGQFVTLLGPSGCGKTTTLRMIAGFEVPTSGQILRDGVDITDQPVTDREMRMVFQDFALFPNMTVAENVAFGLKTRRMKGRFGAAEMRRRVGEYLDLVHLGTHADKRPHQLSGGQKQRVSLARALITDPDVVLFDEPLGSLDAHLRKVMQIELIRLHRELNKTFIYVTHDQDEAMAMSDAIAVMNGGKVQQFGTPREIYDRPTSRYVAGFIGHAHIVEASVVESGASGLSVRLGNGEVVRLDAPASLQRGEAVGLMLRAEDLSLAKPGDGELHGKVSDSLYRGEYIEYVVDLKGGAGTVHVHEPTHAAPFAHGDDVALKVNPAKAHVVGGA
ncbi:ABC transporter ATP-binding protein [Pseudogemmobacter humi]|uniref:Spermidine/putrescine import ATP-binding protein PotA n=1 Tax=Pseudogemmobacter humi TaxID=2483812 RepID=A0A3P5XQI0_9RHOB|nr:ABC transporter ATP-binding protein [Pseudogemmobacter humi]VDC33935.1 Spermidine/putrescine import ATP-binding protein PotA [Pseudogemmobacter humi]